MIWLSDWNTRFVLYLYNFLNEYVCRIFYIFDSFNELQSDYKVELAKELKVGKVLPMSQVPDTLPTPT